MDSYSDHFYYERSQKCKKRQLSSLGLSVFVSVCLSVRMEKLGSHWKDFRENLYISTCRKYVKNFQVLFKI